MKLSVRRIENEKPHATKTKRLADGDGLYLKVVPNGTKTFTFRFSYGRGRPEMTLGTYPAMSLAAAREARIAQERLLEAGKSPLLVKHTAIQAKRDAPTVAELGEEFRDKWLKQTIKGRTRYKRWEDAYSRLERDPIKVLGKLLVPDVTEGHILDVFNRIKDRGSAVAANRTLPLTRLMFQYAVDQHYIDRNPVTLTRRAVGGSESSRHTALLLDQIKHVLEVLASDSHGMALQTRLGIKVILGTAKRPEEVATMEWSHVNFDRAEWLNPSHLTKEDHGDHLVFLNEFTLQALRELLALNPPGCKYVFLSPRWRPGKPMKPINRHSLSSAILDLYNAGTLTVKFTPHDLRRTFSTRMADEGMEPHVGEKSLDHLMTGSMSVYNRASYFKERRLAMQRWGQILQELAA